MNKRYIDFVPAKKDLPKGGLAKPKSIKVTMKTEKPVAKPVPKPVKKVTRRIAPANPLLDEEIEVEEIFAVKEEEPKKAAKPAVKPKTVAKPAVKPAVKSAAKPAAKPVAPKRPAPLGQRTKFINTNKIEKRPLSGATARKKPIVIPKLPEKPKAPEKIITKPEKDSKAGLIIAIILTIILGAAAGTVAFLLLPK